MTDAYVTAGLLLFAALLILVMSLLGHLGRLPRNAVVGVRTRKSLSDDATWRRIHHRFAPYGYAATGLLVVGALVSERPPAVLGALILAVTVMIVGAVRAHA